MKEALVKKADDNLKKVFQYAYDYDKTYGLKFKGPFVIVEDKINYDAMFMILDTLAERKVTGHAAQNLVENFSNEHGDLIKVICNKDLDVGISVTTINKVFPGLVPDFNVQLAKEEALEKLRFPLVAQIKYDGVRVIMLKQNGNVTFRTRNGKTFEWPYMKDMLAQYPDNLMLDGEIVLETGRMEDRTKISGMVNSAIQGTPLTFPAIKFYCFDTMTASSFLSGICHTKYRDRFLHLTELLKNSIDGLELATTTQIDSIKDANAYFEKVLAVGYEGVILKHLDHKYTFKRTKDWVKMKAIKDATLTCVGIQEGEGKYIGMIGALHCEGVVEGKSVAVKVGSGLSDADREKGYTQFVGRPIDVKYNAIIQDTKTGQWSLFLPRYITVRGDIE